ncbi:MAG: acetate CoA-transferase subunit alpha [Candidatus Dactylopiibacterium sp.]|nr:acetate CoA-transferase subunit alpha [Candidatus Dactylopiibacterium sp.]
MSGPSKLLRCAQLRPRFHDGMSVLFGGFMGTGTPARIVREILEGGFRELTLIGNDTAFKDSGVGVLIAARRVRKVITSHIGTNPETGRQMIAGELEVELVPQGTLAERIRCGGSGLGGFLTPTGVGTPVEDGKDTLAYDGIRYLVERPLRADVAILQAHQADAAGNLIYRRAARNFNPLMALAADFVVAEYDELHKTGTLEPDHIMTPGILVDALVSGKEP